MVPIGDAAQAAMKQILDDLGAMSFEDFAALVKEVVDSKAKK